MIRGIFNIKQNINMLSKITKECHIYQNPLRNYTSTSLRSSNLLEKYNQWNFETYFERLFTIPRGFKKFYPKGKNETPSGNIPKEKNNPKSEPGNSEPGVKNETSGAEKGSENTFKSKKKSNPNQKKDDDPFSSMIPISISLATLAVVFLLMDSRGNG